MNCNTTHYRANSSSVPGDPTFAGPLASRGFDPRGRQAVVLGAGGAARSVVHRLARDGALVTLVNRTDERSARLAAEVQALSGAPVRCLRFDDTAGLKDSMAGAELLVNATSVGMSPNVEAMPPIPPDVLHPGLLVYELIYNPVETRLLAAARAAGAQTLNGVQMLVQQGAAAFAIWTGQKPPLDVMEQAVLNGLAAR